MFNVIIRIFVLLLFSFCFIEKSFSHTIRHCDAKIQIEPIYHPYPLIVGPDSVELADLDFTVSTAGHHGSRLHTGPNQNSARRRARDSIKQCLSDWYGPAIPPEGYAPKTATAIAQCDNQTAHQDAQTNDFRAFIQEKTVKEHMAQSLCGRDEITRLGRDGNVSYRTKLTVSGDHYCGSETQYSHSHKSYFDLCLNHGPSEYRTDTNSNKIPDVFESHADGTVVNWEPCDDNSEELCYVCPTGQTYDTGTGRCVGANLDFITKRAGWALAELCGEDKKNCDINRNSDQYISLASLIQHTKWQDIFADLVSDHAVDADCLYKDMRVDACFDIDEFFPAATKPAEESLFSAGLLSIDTTEDEAFVLATRQYDDHNYFVRHIPGTHEVSSDHPSVNPSTHVFGVPFNDDCKPRFFNEHAVIDGAELGFTAEIAGPPVGGTIDCRVRYLERSKLIVLAPIIYFVASGDSDAAQVNGNDALNGLYLINNCTSTLSSDYLFEPSRTRNEINVNYQNHLDRKCTFSNAALTQLIGGFQGLDENSMETAVKLSDFFITFAGQTAFFEFGGAIEWLARFADEGGALFSALSDAFTVAKVFGEFGSGLFALQNIDMVVEAAYAFEACPHADYTCEMMAIGQGLMASVFMALDGVHLGNKAGRSYSDILQEFDLASQTNGGKSDFIKALDGDQGDLFDKVKAEHDAISCGKYTGGSARTTTNTLDFCTIEIGSRTWGGGKLYHQLSEDEKYAVEYWKKHASPQEKVNAIENGTGEVLVGHAMMLEGEKYQPPPGIIIVVPMPYGFGTEIKKLLEMQTGQVPLENMIFITHDAPGPMFSHQTNRDSEYDHLIKENTVDFNDFANTHNAITTDDFVSVYVEPEGNNWNIRRGYKVVYQVGCSVCQLKLGITKFDDIVPKAERYQAVVDRHVSEFERLVNEIVDRRDFEDPNSTFNPQDIKTLQDLEITIDAAYDNNRYQSAKVHDWIAAAKLVSYDFGPLGDGKINNWLYQADQAEHRLFDLLLQLGISTADIEYGEGY